MAAVDLTWRRIPIDPDLTDPDDGSAGLGYHYAKPLPSVQFFSTLIPRLPRMLLMWVGVLDGIYEVGAVAKIRPSRRHPREFAAYAIYLPAMRSTDVYQSHPGWRYYTRKHAAQRYCRKQFEDFMLLDAVHRLAEGPHKWLR